MKAARIALYIIGTALMLLGSGIILLFYIVARQQKDLNRKQMKPAIEKRWPKTPEEKINDALDEIAKKKDDETLKDQLDEDTK